MSRLVMAEFDKLFSTRLWLVILVACAGLTGLYACLTLMFADEPDTWTPPLSTLAGQRVLFSVAQGIGPLVAVLAAIGLTGEYRHKTVTATFLASPRRGRVVLAKLIAYAAVGAAYGLLCAAVNAAIAVPWLASDGIRLAGLAGIASTVAGVLVAITLYGLLGVGLGALLRDQVATVVGLLVYLFVAEPILTHIGALESWTRFLPGPATSALAGNTLTNQTFLPAWQGGLVLTAYGLGAAATGIVFTARRDVT
jgi:ABC-2 type transport system permease protein